MYVYVWVLSMAGRAADSWKQRVCALHARRSLAACSQAGTHAAALAPHALGTTAARACMDAASETTPHFVLCFLVCARSQQRLDHLHVALLNCDVQRSGSMLHGTSSPPHSAA